MLRPGIQGLFGHFRHAQGEEADAADQRQAQPDGHAPRFQSRDGNGGIEEEEDSVHQIERYVHGMNEHGFTHSMYAGGTSGVAMCENPSLAVELLTTLNYSAIPSQVAIEAKPLALDFEMIVLPS